MTHKRIVERKPKENFMRAYVRDGTGRLVWRGQIFTSKIKCQIDSAKNAPVDGKTYGISKIWETPSMFSIDCFWVRLEDGSIIDGDDIDKKTQTNG